LNLKKEEKYLQGKKSKIFLWNLENRITRKTRRKQKQILSSCNVFSFHLLSFFNFNFLLFNSSIFFFFSLLSLFAYALVSQTRKKKKKQGKG
jgi:hypothetical protein